MSTPWFGLTYCDVVSFNHLDMDVPNQGDRAPHPSRPL
jgi:hypothetical protein